MLEPLLLLRLEGPLQSWGLRSHWDVRDSAREPTKSGIIGLLSAALGYERDDSRIGQLDADLHFGVRVDREGGMLDDYHTVSGFFPMADGAFKASGRTAKQLQVLVDDPDAEPYTIQSSRRYITDASFLVVVADASGARPALLEQCAEALRRPCWPLFLGRRTCVPARPIFEALTHAYSGVIDALKQHPWSCLGTNGVLRHRPPDRLRIVVESESGSARDDRRASGPERRYRRGFVKEEWVQRPVAPQGQEQ